MMLTEYNEEETMKLFKQEYIEEGRAEERAAIAVEMAALKAELEKYRAAGISV